MTPGCSTRSSPDGPLAIYDPAGFGKQPRSLIVAAVLAPCHITRNCLITKAPISAIPNFIKLQLHKKALHNILRTIQSPISIYIYIHTYIHTYISKSSKLVPSLRQHITTSHATQKIPGRRKRDEMHEVRPREPALGALETQRLHVPI